MRRIKKVKVFGDSILKGVQVSDFNNRYCVNNNIDVPMLCNKYNLEVTNVSMMGSTVVHAQEMLDKYVLDEECDAVVMDFGGNDSNFLWEQIANEPDREHMPKTPIEKFKEIYVAIIRKLKSRGIKPIVTTLPPLDAKRFLDWWCGKLDRASVMKWLKSEEAVYDFHESYSKMVESIAVEEKIHLVDIRKYFLNYGNTVDLLCRDGTHPNTKGQQLITAAFYEFAGKMM